MKLAVLLFGAILAAPAAAQTTNDDMSSTENWWDKVGSGFFSEASLRTPRAELEIRAQWTGLSADDQAAVRARCDAAEGETAAAAPSLREGDEDEQPDATGADLADAIPPVADATPSDGADTPQNTADAQATTTTGSVAGQEVQRASPSDTPEPYTGLAGAPGENGANMVLICDLVRKL